MQCEAPNLSPRLFVNHANVLVASLISTNLERGDRVAETLFIFLLGTKGHFSHRRMKAVCSNCDIKNSLFCAFKGYT